MKHTFLNLSVRGKLMLIMMATSIASLLLVSTTFIFYEQEQSKRELMRDMDSITEIISSNSIAALLFNDPASAEETLKTLRSEPHFVAACLYTHKRQVFAKYLRNAEKADCPIDPRGEALHFEEEHFISLKEIVFEQQQIGTLYLQSDMKHLDVRLNRYISIVMAVMLAAVLTAFLFSSRLKHLILKPILHLSDIASHVSENKDYAIRATKVSNDELGLLTTRFNEMLEEIQKAEARLQHEATHDQLTGLPNRTLFMELLGRSVERRKRNKSYLFALLFLDLDRFKIVNDSLGHAVGDQLLGGIAHRLKESLRGQDTVARLGGDEFTVLLDDIHQSKDAIEMANRIRQDLSAPFDLNGQEIHAEVSIGIVVSSEDEAAETLLRDADTAMYRAKALGGSRQEIFEVNMHDHAMTRMALENDLRNAVKREEFKVFYQAIVTLSSGRIAGFEALVRWQHPTMGLLPPSRFIPLAEETNLIVSIDRWVLRTACTQMAKWHSQSNLKSHWSISVNLSGKQFLQTDLIDSYDKIIKESGLAPNQIQLEITETVLMENPDQKQLLLKALQSKGIFLSLDDFGTGYSSLSYLHRFPFNVLKIDRSFVSQLGMAGNQAEIIKTITMMAHNLGLLVIAEGVETAEQLSYLKDQHCEYGQGYFFSEPVTGEVAESMA